MSERPLIFALTGGIGSGKSTVAGFLREAGIPVVDADEIARSITKKGGPLLPRLAERFGDHILTESGELDRKALARIVFGNDGARAALEGLVHPEIRREAETAFERLAKQGHGLICYEIPLLFETNQQERFRPVIVVHVPRAAQLARTMRRDDMTEEDAEARILAQLDLEYKAGEADFVIDNSGTLDSTRAQVLSVLEQIQDGKGAS